MAEQLQQLRIKVEQAKTDIDWLLHDPSPEQKLMLERGKKTLVSFLTDDYPNISKAFGAK